MVKALLPWLSFTQIPAAIVFLSTQSAAQAHCRICTKWRLATDDGDFRPTDGSAAQGRVRLAKKLMAEAATQAPGTSPVSATATALGVSPAKSTSALADKSPTSAELPMQKANHPMYPCINCAEDSALHAWRSLPQQALLYKHKQACSAAAKL